MKLSTEAENYLTEYLKKAKHSTELFIKDNESYASMKKAIVHAKNKLKWIDEILSNK